MRAIAQGEHSLLNPNDLPDELGGVNTPWNPALAGLPNVSENFYLVQFIKDVYLDSQVSVGLMSNNTSAAIPMWPVTVVRPRTSASRRSASS